MRPTNNKLGILYSSSGHIHAWSKTTESMLIWRTDLTQKTNILASSNSRKALNSQHLWKPHYPTQVLSVCCAPQFLTCKNATSRFNMPRRNKWGISHRNMGVKSAAPAFTALRKLGPINREFDRKIPEIKKITKSIHTPATQTSNPDYFVCEKTRKL